VILLALTGGIGSGKSSVSTRLEARGAVLVDADLITRELQAPGGAVLEAMVERWGTKILAEDGTLNRQAVADLVFNEADELAALNKIVHPAVRREMRRQAAVAGEADPDRPVVMDIPLLVEGLSYWPPFSGVVVVDTPLEVAVERLVTHRGFPEDDAWARVSRQVSREERLAVAGFVVDNSGTPQQLEEQVERLWEWIATRDQVAVPTVKPPKSEDESASS
jgi:dephospho-CoA kinase